MRHQTTTPHLKSCATGSIAAVAGCNGSHGGGGGLDKVGVLRPGERQDVNASCKIPQRESRGQVWEMPPSEIQRCCGMQTGGTSAWLAGRHERRATSASHAKQGA